MTDQKVWIILIILAIAAVYIIRLIKKDNK